jgi:competence protein ComEC
VKPLNAWPRQPFVGVAIAASAGILVADFRPGSAPSVAIALGALGIATFFTRASPLVYAFIASSFFFLHSLRTSDTPGIQLARELGEEPRPATIRGTVTSEPKLSANQFASFLLQAESVEIDGETRPCRAKLFARWRHAVEFGDELKLFGTLEKIQPPRNPGEFDMASYLARQDVRRALIVRYAENGAVLSHSGGSSILRAAQKSRDWMRRVLCRDLENSPDVTSSISGMVLGLRHQTPEDIEEPFQQTGTLHLFAVAGLHVGIVARLLWILATILRLPKKWATLLIVPALLFYSAVTGLHTSSVRAAVMSAVLLGGFLVERKAFARNNLAAAAVLILCWDTNELFSTGFQLSFSVVAAIIILADPAFQFLRRRFEPDSFLPRSLFTARRRALNRCLSWLARAVSVSIAAWVGSLPLMLWDYHLVTLSSVVANLVVVPIAFFVLAGGLLSLVTAPLSGWVSLVFNNANWALTKIILGVVHLFAQLPGGHFYLEHPGWTSGTKLEINVLDLRSGAAVHVRTGNQDWLFDAGAARDYNRSLQPYLRSRGVNRLDGFALTHGDASHVGGAAGVLLDFHPRQFFDTKARSRSAIHRQLLALSVTDQNAPKCCQAGDEFNLSRDVKARILFPPAGFETESADDQTLVFQLIVSGKPCALFTSDSGTATESFLLEKYPDLRSDILVKGQHRSGNSGSDAFLDRVQPKAIIATARDFPESQRMKPEWAEKMQARGIKLFRQDETGAVQIRIFQDRWEARTYVTSETFRRPRR